MTSIQRRLLWQNGQTSQPRPTKIPIADVFRFTGIILIGVFIVTAVVLFMSRSTGTHSNPFTLYASIFPGQPRAQAETYGFACYHYSFGSPYFGDGCTLHPETGIFSDVRISIDNNVINTLYFTPRKGTFTLGDVVLALGMPQGIQRFYIISGSEGNYRAVVDMDALQFNYFLSVRQIVLW